MTLARPRYLVIPQAGEPVLVIQGAPQWRPSWLTNVRRYTPLSVAPVEAIADALREAGLLGGRVGVELGFEQRIGIPLAEYQRIEAAVQPSVLTDCADALWGRTQGEVGARSRARPARRDRGEPGLRGSLRCDAGRRHGGELATRMRASLVARGGYDPFVYIATGRTRYGLNPSGANDPIVRGDMVWMDVGCSVDGYWTDFSRASIVGDPTKEQETAWATITSITAAAVRLATVGRRCSDMARFANEAVAESGLPLERWLSRDSGRVGHAMGFDITEPPHIAEYDDTPLEEGMVIAIEPNVATDYGKFHAEQNMIVTAARPKSFPCWTIDSATSLPDQKVPPTRQV